MFLVYSYVDISWDARNMVLLGLAAAICAHPLGERSPARRDALPSSHDVAAGPDPSDVVDETTPAIRSA